jgi:4-amino-4-deoxy-L-arabinose transferase-like glycosyltransferase
MSRLGARAICLAMIAVIVVLGAIVALRFPVWAIDESAHYSYIQSIAEDGRLPILREDYLSPEATAILEKTYPDPAIRDPRELGIYGQSYEAFQPPLYYVVAAPVFLLASDYERKIDVLRLFDLLLYALAILALWRLARLVFGERWPLAFAAGLTMFLWPGFVARGVTISNSALALPLGLFFLHELWVTDRDRDTGRHLFAAAALLGLALLTKLTLVFLVVPFGLVIARLAWRGRDRRTLIRLGLALVLPLVLLSPWLAFNLDQYGSLTSNDIGVDLQREARSFNPDYGIRDIPEFTGSLLDSFLPEEWKQVSCEDGGAGDAAFEGDQACSFADYRNDLTSAAAIVLKVLFYGLPTLALLLMPRLLASRAAMLLVLPVVVSVAIIQITLVVEDWSLFYPRHYYPVLPAFALFAVIAWRGLFKREWAVAGLVAVSVLCSAVFWLDRALGVGHL